MKYYIAYGSNLVKEEMSSRCPLAQKVLITVLENYRLAFKGLKDMSFLTIEPSEGHLVPVVVYKITPLDEFYLDEYEGYPDLYTKQEISVKYNNEIINAFTYVMTPSHSYNLPSGRYLERCMQGYKDYQLHHKYLMEAYDYTKSQLPKKLIK